MGKKSHFIKEAFLTPIWRENQIIHSILGICSALAVTGNVIVAFTMGLSVCIVTACSSFFISLFRHRTPDSVRMIFQLAVIATFVIIVDEFLRAYFFDISKILSVFVGLIITNCIVMGRAESMARHSPPIPAFFDGLGAGMGYAWVLLVVSSIRELLGFGTLVNCEVIPSSWYASAVHPHGYQNFAFFALPASSFFILGLLIGLVHGISALKSKKRG